MTAPAPLSPEEFALAAGVDAAALDRLGAYADLLRTWQRRINLVGKATLDDLWRRHMLDSAQLKAIIPSHTETLLDLGSGAGFPGLVLAILGVRGVHLVESDARKCAFLQEAARITGASVKIHRCRIEALEPFAVDVITARACAPLPKLLDLVEPFLSISTICVFPKGRTAEEELTDLQKNWMIKTSRIRSLTDPFAQILKLEVIRRRHGP